MANKRRIIVVDDNRDILCSVGQILEAKGYKVYLFEDGQDCLRGKYALPYTDELREILDEANKEK